jgi:hypothetical protein
MARELPGSVVNSLRVLALIVAASGVTTALTWVMRDDLIRSWMKGNASAIEIFNQGGIEALRDNQITPGFVAIAVVAFVGLALHVLVVAAFFVGGYGWARIVLTATAAVVVLVAGTALGMDLPAAFVVCAAVLVLLGLVLVFFLWRKETTAYLREV